MILYKGPSGIISLSVESSKSAIVAGDDEIHYGTLTFHYRNEGRFKVITWTAHNLSYALVFLDQKFGAGILHGLSSKHGRPRLVQHAALARLSSRT